MTPSFPVATSSEAESEGRLAITVSARSATSLGDEAACAPSAASLSTASLRVSKTTSECPASIRRRAMGKPILPRPMNPMSMISLPLRVIARSESDEAIQNFRGRTLDCFASLAMTEQSLGGLRLIEFGKNFAGDAEAVDAAGNAGIDRDLHENFAYLVPAHAVGERAPDVSPQFVRPVEDRNHRKIEHAAGLARKFLAAPDCPPAIFSDEFLERLVELIGVFQRVGDVSLAKHGFSDFQSLVVRFLVHDTSLKLALLPSNRCSDSEVRKPSWRPLMRTSESRELRQAIVSGAALNLKFLLRTCRVTDRNFKFAAPVLLRGREGLVTPSLCAIPGVGHQSCVGASTAPLC